MFSNALEDSVKLGLRQGLTKGIAVGSNSVTLAIWAFMAWYGSGIVMYHGGKRGTVFAVGNAIVTGGISYSLSPLCINVASFILLCSFLSSISFA
ncbi:hypothetical protein B296_00050776 [Ensete ventricosum]|uniref:Uncharacterized protein n=1 Tax=Ensete ventricosum TaxID=4639 RepID=A0A426X9M5_ENSVE|nr:hypothetical protein B296_00050776 [Ensete ventricosum]